MFCVFFDFTAYRAAYWRVSSGLTLRMPPPGVDHSRMVSGEVFVSGRVYFVTPARCACAALRAGVCCRITSYTAATLPFMVATPPFLLIVLQFLAEALLFMAATLPYAVWPVAVQCVRVVLLFMLTTPPFMAAILRYSAAMLTFMAAMMLGVWYQRPCSCELSAVPPSLPLNPRP